MDLRTSTHARRLGAVVISFVLVVIGLGLAPPAAHADAVVKPKNGAFTLQGSGYGHGIGMSQYGAYGAAQKGLTWQQILDFYYPGTTRAKQPASQQIRVWITGDHDNDLRVAASAGLRLTDSAGKAYVLPTNLGATWWRVTRSGSTWRLWSYAQGKWTARTAKGLDPARQWTFSNNAQLLRMALTNRDRLALRGKLTLALSGSGAVTVNVVPTTQYLKSVVPAEIPVSWHAHAVRAQTVAARSYAARLQASAPASQPYDLCDTTACQVYPGHARKPLTGTRVAFEHAAGNSAIAATRDVVLKYGSTYALTQFSSSNAGHSVAGSQPYLKAKKDPYDGVPKSQAWTARITTAAMQGKWPSVGTVTGLQVSKRDGKGPYGGRATTVVVTGSKGKVTVAGTDFRVALGLRSTVFRVTAG